MKEKRFASVQSEIFCLPELMKAGLTLKASFKSYVFPKIL